MKRQTLAIHQNLFFIQSLNISSLRLIIFKIFFLTLRGFLLMLRNLGLRNMFMTEIEWRARATGAKSDVRVGGCHGESDTHYTLFSKQTILLLINSFYAKSRNATKRKNTRWKLVFTSNKLNHCNMHTMRFFTNFCAELVRQGSMFCFMLSTMVLWKLLAYSILYFVSLIKRNRAALTSLWQDFGLFVSTK